MAPGFLKIIDRYVLRKFLSTFFFAILILAVISCVIDYSQKVDDFVEKKAPSAAIAIYFLNFIPHITALLFPLFVFISTIFFTSKMAYKTEIIATLAAGVSFQRFLRPFVYGAILLGVFSLVVNHWVVPNANKNIIDFHYKYIWDKKYGVANNMHIRVDSNTYAYVEGYNFNSNEASRFTVETIEGNLLVEKVMAEKAHYDTLKKNWKLNNVVIRKNDGLQETLEKQNELIAQYAFAPDDLDDDNRNKDAMTTPELLRFIAKEKLRGKETVNAYAIELHKRSAQPFAGFVLTMIGACIASRKVRGGSGLHLALGVVLSAIYMLFIQFTQTFSINAGLDPLLAVWIPNFLFGIVAIVLFRRQIK